MSAIPEEFITKTARLSEEVTRPFANSRKIYVEGSRPDLRVPMREVAQSPTHTSGEAEENPPIYVYDTSGPYTDPTVKIDLMKGMPDVRGAWIEERGDSELLAAATSDYGRARQGDPALGILEQADRHADRRADRRRRRLLVLGGGRAQGEVLHLEVDVAIQGASAGGGLGLGAERPAFQIHPDRILGIG